jgi:hypothetical protein
LFLFPFYPLFGTIPNYHTLPHLSTIISTISAGNENLFQSQSPSDERPHFLPALKGAGRQRLPSFASVLRRRSFQIQNQKFKIINPLLSFFIVPQHNVQAIA